MRSTSIVAAAVTSSLFVAGANASTVDLRFVGVGQGQTVRATIGSSTFNCFAGQLKHQFTNGTGQGQQFNGQTRVTFCTDLTEYVTSSYRTYTLTDVKNVPNSAGWPTMGQDRADALSLIFGHADDSLTLNSVSPSYAAAFQVAIWEIVYDYNSANPASFDLNSGNFKAKNTNGTALSGSIVTQLATITDDLAKSGQYAELIGLARSGNQDQLIRTTPLPSAGLLGLAGLGAVGSLRRRRA